MRIKLSRTAAALFFKLWVLVAVLALVASVALAVAAAVAADAMVEELSEFRAVINGIGIVR